MPGVIIVLVFDGRSLPMKKHIFGFALFLFIVSSAIVTYRFLYAPPVPDVEVVHINHDAPPPAQYVGLGSKTAEVLSCEIKNIVLDVEGGYGTADVTFRWNSSEPPPGGLIVELGLTTADRPFEGRGIGFARIGSVWKNNTMTENVKFLLEGRADGLDLKKNYYGYVEASDWKGGDERVKLIYREKDRMTGAAPVLIKHGKK